MDTTTIVIFFAIVVFASIGIIVISQMRERAKIEKARHLTALQDTYNRSHRLLDEIPGQYMTPELKLLLVKRIEETCRNLDQLGSDLPTAKWRSDALAIKQKVVDGNDETAATKIDSPEKATHVKELLQNLFKMIESLQKTGRIDNTTARKNLKHVLFLVHKTHADMHVFQARAYIKQDEIRKAIHAYHLASTEMNKSQDNPPAMKAVKSFRGRIKELEAALADGVTTEPKEQQHRLDKEWDNFLQDDDSWKKKADYDN